MLRTSDTFIERTTRLFQYAQLNITDDTKVMLRSFRTAAGSNAEADTLRWLLVGMARQYLRILPDPSLRDKQGESRYITPLSDGRYQFRAVAGTDILTVQYRREHRGYTLTHDALYQTAVIDNYGQTQAAPPTIIEFDSDMWHNDRRFKDVLRDHYARLDGYNVIRVPETNNDNEFTKFVPLFPYTDLAKLFAPHEPEEVLAWV